MTKKNIRTVICVPTAIGTLSEAASTNKNQKFPTQAKLSCFKLLQQWDCFSWFGRSSILCHHINNNCMNLIIQLTCLPTDAISLPKLIHHFSFHLLPSTFRYQFMCSFESFGDFRKNRLRWNFSERTFFDVIDGDLAHFYFRSFSIDQQRSWVNNKFSIIATDFRSAQSHGE